MSVTPDDFKAALSSWPSGVSIVASHFEGIERAMTVSSFASVSLSPPVVSVCLANDARTLALIKGSRVFAVSILSHTQAEVSNACATHEADGLQLVQHSRGVNQCALIDGATTHIECQTRDLLEAGDHTLVLGVVTRVALTGSAPLLYCNRTYGTFASW